MRKFDGPDCHWQALNVRIPSRSHVIAIAVGAVVLFIATLMGLSAFLVSQSRVSALNNGAGQAERFIKLAEVAFNRNLLSVDVLLSVTERLVDIGALMQGPLETYAFAEKVNAALNQNQLVSLLMLLDASGHLVAASDAVVRSGEWPLPSGFIQDVLSQNSSTLVVSAPTRSSMTSEPVLLMGRLIVTPRHGRAILLGEVPISRMTGIHTNGSGIEDLETTLERANGDILVANPPVQHAEPPAPIAPLGTAPPWSPTEIIAARVSAEPAIVAVRKTMYANLYLTASIPQVVVLREWQRDVWYIKAVTLALSILSVAIGFFSVWYLNKVAHTQAALGKAKEALDLALISMESGFVQLDAQRKVVNWNQRFVDLHQWLAGHVVRHVPFVQLMQRTAAHLLPQANETERMQWAAQRMELLDGNHDSRQVTDPDGTIIEISERATPDGGIVIVYQDVTRLRSAMAHVELLAFYDPLTGLPNRRLLNDRLRHSLHASMRSQRHGALLFLDLDHFKTLNDTCGHVVGDELLQQVSARLKRCVREEDTVSRFGGDEFVVMLENLSADVQEATQQATAVGQDILAQMNLPYVLLNNDYRCTCSVGATLFGAEQHDAHELLQQADIAMYQVKGSGRNAMCFFDPQMLAAITSRSHLERDLRQALTAHQLVLHYQVQVANSGRPVGAEVLIRWNHPQRGLVMPSQFIGLAEETGIIVSIGEWVLASACEQLQAWAHQPQFSQLQLAVNVSARQFQADNFVAVVSTLIEQYRIDAALLKLELTESLVLNNIAHTTQKMKALKQLGVRFSMDDFGTGYSSLAYLTELPLDQLKVDQSFVRNIGVKASDCAVINTIIGLGRSLSLEVIAEGVETLEQRDFLAQHGCNLCQGYLFGKPVPLANFEASFNAIFEANVVHSLPWAAPGRDQPALHAVA